MVYLTSIWHDSSRWSNLYWRQPIRWPNIQNYTGSKLELNVKLMLIWWAHEAHFDSSWEPILWWAHKRCQLMGPLTICTWLPGCRGPKFIALLKWAAPRYLHWDRRPIMAERAHNQSKELFSVKGAHNHKFLLQASWK